MNFWILFVVVFLLTVLVYNRLERASYELEYDGSVIEKDKDILYKGEHFLDYPEGLRSFESFTEFLQLNPVTGELEVSIPELKGRRLILEDRPKALQISNGYLHFAGYPQLRLCGNIDHKNIGQSLATGEGAQHCGVYRKGNTIFKCVRSDYLRDLFNAMKVMLAQKQNLPIASYLLSVLGIYFDPSPKQLQVYIESEYMNKGSLNQTRMANNWTTSAQDWEAIKKLIFGILRSPPRVLQLDSHEGNYFFSQKPDGSVKAVIGDITSLEWGAFNSQVTKLSSDAGTFLYMLRTLIRLDDEKLQNEMYTELFDVLNTLTLRTNHAQPLQENEMYYIDYALFICATLRLYRFRIFSVEEKILSILRYPATMVAIKRVFSAPKEYYANLAFEKDYLAQMEKEMKDYLPAEFYTDFKTSYLSWKQS